MIHFATATHLSDLVYIYMFIAIGQQQSHNCTPDTLIPPNCIPQIDNHIIEDSSFG